MINHLGIQVEKMQPVIDMFKQRGANVSDSRVSPTKAILSNITDAEHAPHRAGRAGARVASTDQAIQKWN